MYLFLFEASSSLIKSLIWLNGSVYTTQLMFLIILFKVITRLENSLPISEFTGYHCMITKKNAEICNSFQVLE